MQYRSFDTFQINQKHFWNILLPAPYLEPVQAMTADVHDHVSFGPTFQVVGLIWIVILG
jgi:hypothetical protein